MGVQRFRDVAVGAAGVGPGAVRLERLSGKDDQPGVAQFLAPVQSAAQFRTVGARHHRIHQNAIGPLVDRIGERRFAVGVAVNLVAFRDQGRRYEFESRGIVDDDEEGSFPIRSHEFSF